MKKTLSIILALVMTVLMIPATTFAANIGSVEPGYTPSSSALPVSTAAEFEAMQGGNEYYLTGNIDFGGKKYTDYIASKADFKLDGCGYAITGFEISCDASKGIAMYEKPEAGLVIKNLTFGSETKPIKVTSTKDNCGILLTRLATEVTFENLKFYVNMDAKKNAGVITPFMDSTAARDMIIRNCEVNGTISGADVGGFFGHLRQVPVDTFVVDGCVNNATITADEGSYDAGGIVGYSMSALNITNCVNNGAVTTNGERAGGIIGGFGLKTGNTLNIVGCSNYGTITGNKTGSNGASKDINYNAGIGGIVGCTNNFAYQYSSKIVIEKCMNYGTIKTNGLSAGAIMGKGVAAADGYASQIIIKDCGNTGAVNYGVTNTPVGSFISAMSSECTSSLIITNCFNIGSSNSSKALAGVYNLNGDPSKGDTSVVDFYYLEGSFTDAANKANVKVSNSVACSSEKFASGAIAFALGSSFGQSIGTDTYPIPGGAAVTKVGDNYVNMNTLSTDTDGSASPYVQETAPADGKQSVRFVIAVNASKVADADDVEMIITFKKTGAQDVSYTLENGEVKVFKKVIANSEVYVGANGVALVGATVKDVTAADWESVSIVLTVKDTNGENISELCTSAIYTK